MENLFDEYEEDTKFDFKDEVNEDICFNEILGPDGTTKMLMEAVDYDYYWNKRLEK